MMHPPKSQNLKFSKTWRSGARLSHFGFWAKSTKFPINQAFLRLLGTSKDFSEAYKYDASTKVTKSEIFQNVGVWGKIIPFWLFKSSRLHKIFVIMETELTIGTEKLFSRRSVTDNCVSLLLPKLDILKMDVFLNSILP